MTSKTERGPRLTNQGPRNSNESPTAKHTPGVPELRLAIATAATKESRSWRNGTVGWGELWDWMEEPASRKECGGYMMGHLLEDPGPRVRENVVSRSAITLDADKAKPDLLDRVAAVLTDPDLGVGVAWLAHTTFSSTLKEPRWRIIVPLAEPVDADTYTALSRALLHKIDPDGLEFDVAASTRPEQFMWKPAVPKGVKLRVAGVLSGPLLDPDTYAVALVAELRAILAEERAASAALVVEVDRDPTADEIEAAGALLAHEVGRVRAAEPGQRNETVASALYRVFRFVKTGCLDEDATVAALEEAAPFGDGYTAAEFRASLDGARRKAPAEWPKLTVGTAADDFTVVDDQLAAELGLEPEPAASDEVTPNPAGVRRALQDLVDRAEASRRFALRHRQDLGQAERAVAGDAFLLDLPETPPVIWGAGKAAILTEGEALLLAGPPGVGKTTVGGQVVRGLMVGGTVLGYPVRPGFRVLYLAMDRPQQIQRALARTLGKVDPQVLRDQLVFWKGPLPGDLMTDQELLLRLAREHGADAVVVDSLKDALVGIAEDRGGAAYNMARQHCLAGGVQLVELHHMVKKGGEGRPPNTLADVYGSGWITAGAGSVVLLDGSAGDLVVRWRHLKQPLEPVGPFDVVHDHDAGVSRVLDRVDPLAVLRLHPDGVTAADAAKALYGTDQPSKADVERARRELAKLEDRGLASVVDGDRAAGVARRWLLGGSVAEDFEDDLDDEDQL